jgi:hypothetical protein
MIAIRSQNDHDSIAEPIAMQLQNNRDLIAELLRLQNDCDVIAE